MKSFVRVTNSKSNYGACHFYARGIFYKYMKLFYNLVSLTNLITKWLQNPMSVIFSSCKFKNFVSDGFQISQPGKGSLPQSFFVGLSYLIEEFVHGDRLYDIIKGPKLHTLDTGLNRLITGQHDDLNPGGIGFDPS